jgi:hypothetical protein
LQNRITVKLRGNSRFEMSGSSEANWVQKNHFLCFPSKNPANHWILAAETAEIPPVFRLSRPDISPVISPVPACYLRVISVFWNSSQVHASTNAKEPTPSREAWFRQKYQ